MKTIFFILLCTVFTLASFAQTKTITGKVFDAFSKEPLQGASVSDHHFKSTVNDASGRFSITTADNHINMNSWPGAENR